MLKRLFLLLSLLIFIDSCGPSSEEVRIHKERIEVGKTLRENKIKEMLSDVQAKLETAKMQLERAKGFKFLRTTSERNREITTHNERIAQAEKMAEGLNKELALVKLHQQYEFQKDPETLISYVIRASQVKEFGKFRHLCDPYGDYDSECFSLSLIDVMPREMQQRWTSTFSSGRIIGEPFISDELAQIEVAIGSSSNHLEKIHLINRMGWWYLKSM